MEPTFFGTEEETYYRSSKGLWWLVQSPDLSPGQVAVSADGPPVGASELRWESCSDFHALARGLDKCRYGGVVSAPALAESGPDVEFVGYAEIAERFGTDVERAVRSLSRGEAEQLWEQETTITKL